MKKSLLLLLMLMAAYSAALSAQEMGQTAAPGFNMGYFEDLTDHDYMGQGDCNIFLAGQYAYVETIDNLDEEDATIYYRFADDVSEWIEYTGGSIDTVPMGIHYAQVEAYAQAEGKLPSDIVCAEVYYHVFFAYAACYVDGIHYILRNHLGSMDEDFLNAEYVSVCSMNDSRIYSQPYSGDIVIPAEMA